VKNTIEKSELIKALKMVIPATSKGDSLLSGADVLVFSPNLVQTYNAHLSISYPVDTGMEGAIKAAELTKIVSKMSAEMITLEGGEKSITVTGGGTELTMILVESPVGNLAAALDLESLEWSEIPGDLLPGISLCLFSVSANPSHGVFRGIRVEGLDVISTDNYRASFFLLEDPMPAFTIPGESAEELLKIPELESFSVSESWVHFKNSDGVVFSAKTLATEYPVAKVKGIFPNDLPDEPFTVPGGLDAALERAAILSSSSAFGQSYISLYREDGFLVCKGEKEFGLIKDRIPAAPGEWPLGVEMKVNPKFLKDIISKSNKFHITESGIVVFGGGNFHHVMSSIKRA
jgi:DNA polymerase III sliding clamp (beta) subunit (PCNA family)